MEKLVSTMTFGRSGIHLLEHWSIVAEAPLDELLIELNAQPQGAVDLLGAEIVPVAPFRPEPDRPGLLLRLPDPLGPDESHHLELRLAIAGPAGQHLCRPAVTCRRLDVRVHFDSAAAPGQIWSLGPETRSEIRLSRVREAEATFERTVPGGRYGLTWSRAS